MQINLDPGSATNRIVGYGHGFVLLNEDRFESSFVVMPETILTDWPPETVEDLAVEHLETIIELGPELIVIGTGDRQKFPDTAVLRPLIDGGIGFEIMDTRAACRTYNILMAEGRVVAAALMMVNH